MRTFYDEHFACKRRCSRYHFLNLESTSFRYKPHCRACNRPSEETTFASVSLGILWLASQFLFQMLSLVVLAIERYQAIVKPMTSHMTRLRKEHINCVIASAWILSVICAMPGFITANTTSSSKGAWIHGRSTIEKALSRKLYITVKTVFTAILFSCLFYYCYFQIHLYAFKKAFTLAKQCAVRR